MYIHNIKKINLIGGGDLHERTKWYQKIQITVKMKSFSPGIYKIAETYILLYDRH